MPKRISQNDLDFIVKLIAQVPDGCTLNEIQKKAYEAGYNKGKEDGAYVKGYEDGKRDAKREFEEQQANAQEDVMAKRVPYIWSRSAAQAAPDTLRHQWQGG